MSEWQTRPFPFLTTPWWPTCATAWQVGLNTRFADMRKAFKYVDLDNSGTVDRSELERALQLWNVPMTKTHIDVFWEKCDEDKTGEISYAEFVNMLARDTAGATVAPKGPKNARMSVENEAMMAKLQETEDTIYSRFSDMRKAFKHVDFDASGTVNRQELERALQMMNLGLSPQQIDYLWRRCAGLAAATQPLSHARNEVRRATVARAHG